MEIFHCHVSLLEGNWYVSKICENQAQNEIHLLSPSFIQLLPPPFKLAPNSSYSPHLAVGCFPHVPSPHKFSGHPNNLRVLPAGATFLALWFFWLVVEPTHLKNMLVKLDRFPKVWGENKTYMSCHHHLVFVFLKNQPLQFQRPLIFFGLSEKNVILVGVYNQQSFLMVFDLEGNDGLVKQKSTLHGRRVDIPPLEKL